MIICGAGSPLLPAVCLVQEVDVGKHNWGNYFVAAYKVRSWAWW